MYIRGRLDEQDIGKGHYYRELYRSDDSDSSFEKFDALSERDLVHSAELGA